MRRQVKPFVTEYRGTSRRSKDLPASGELQHEPQAPKSRSYAEAEKAFHAPETPEDSYEAALRAADALFAAPARKAMPPSVETPLSETGARRAPRVVSPAAMSGDDAGKASTEADDDTARDLEAAESDTAPRRILRAIESAPEDRFAALEAERAPKRRGRKPGSKNKPKIVIGDDWASPAARPVATRPASGRPAAARPAVRPAGASAQRPSFLDRYPAFAMSEADETVEVDNVTEAVGGEQAMPQPRGRNEKFGWKRAGLRPGERWKRRLPKAAW